MIIIDGKIVEMSKEDNENEPFSYFIVKKLTKNTKLSLTKAIKIMIENHPEYKTSVQNIQSKLLRGSIRFTEFYGLAEACGYDISLIKVEEDQSDDMSIIDSLGKERYDWFMKKIAKGFDIIPSANFGHVLFIGEDSELAVEWVKEKLNTYMDITRELSVYALAKQKFNVICSPVNLDD